MHHPLLKETYYYIYYEGVILLIVNFLYIYSCISYLYAQHFTFKTREKFFLTLYIMKKYT